jgi:hypothetical protein
MQIGIRRCLIILSMWLLIRMRRTLTTARDRWPSRLVTVHEPTSFENAARVVPSTRRPHAAARGPEGGVAVACCLWWCSHVSRTSPPFPVVHRGAFWPLGVAAARELARSRPARTALRWMRAGRILSHGGGWWDALGDWQVSGERATAPCDEAVADTGCKRERVILLDSEAMSQRKLDRSDDGSRPGMVPAVVD